VERMKEAFSLSVIPAMGFAALLLWADSSSSINPLGAAVSQREVVTLLPKESIFEVFPEEEIEIEEEAPVIVPGKSYIYQRSLRAKVTGYTPGEESCGPYADGFTSTMSNAWSAWGVAADPTHLPYGTLVFIPGVGYREVDDTGSAMRNAWRKNKETHIDLRFQKLNAAKEWGVRHLTVHVFLPEEVAP